MQDISSSPLLINATKLSNDNDLANSLSRGDLNKLKCIGTDQADLEEEEKGGDCYEHQSSGINEAAANSSD